MSLGQQFPIVFEEYVLDSDSMGSVSSFVKVGLLRISSDFSFSDVCLIQHVHWPWLCCSFMSLSMISFCGAIKKLLLLSSLLGWLKKNQRDGERKNFSKYEMLVIQV